MNGTDRTTGERRIVVGVDGSRPSRAALRWALGEARLTGAVVEAVTSWDEPGVYGRGITVSLEESDAVAGAELAELVTRETGRAPGAAVRQRVEHGSAGEVLVKLSEGAALLVVGGRGLGGFVGALLGSVARYCVRHAHCPVVLVRGDFAAGPVGDGRPAARGPSGRSPGPSGPRETAAGSAD
ncbi:universal stress protein [Kitasatospora sp. NPDC094016]|uniref:universal stress protein n=1 Tax=Kitasatospora sp. NPDC094016 TaxID=3154986 RepID=UPI003320AFDD